MTNFLKKSPNFLKLCLFFSLIILNSCFLTKTVSADTLSDLTNSFNTLIPTDNTTNNSNSAIQTRTNKDTQQTQTEAQKTTQLQQQDLKECTAQASGNNSNGNNGTGGNGVGSTPTTGNINPDGSTSNKNQAGSQNDSFDPANPAYGTPSTATTQSAEDAKSRFINYEGYKTTPYADPVSGTDIGIGHQITGNEPADITASINSGTPLTDEQINRLYVADYNRTQQGAVADAASHGIYLDYKDAAAHGIADKDNNGPYWNSFTTDQKLAITDIGYTHGTGGLNGFNNMWDGIRQGNLQQASNEVLLDRNGNTSDYGQTTRAQDNARAILTGKFTFNWLDSSINFLARLFKTDKIKIALAPKRVEADTVSAYADLIGLSPEALFQSLDNLGVENLIVTIQGLSSDERYAILSKIISGGSGQSEAFLILNKIPGHIRGAILGQMTSNQLSSIFSNFTAKQINTLLNTIPKPELGTALNQLNGNALSIILGKLSADQTGRLLQYMPSDTFSSLVNKLPSNYLNTLTSGMSSPLLGNLLTNASGNTAGQLLNGMSANTMSSMIQKMPTPALSSLTQQPAVSSAMQSTLGSASPTIQQAVAPALQSAGSSLAPAGSSALSPLTNTATNAANSASSAVSSALGLFVPVVEQNGQLMTHAGNIDQNTKDIRGLSIQICTHLKAIHRIEARAEAQVVENADTRRIASTEIEKWRQALTDLLKKGYVNNNGTTKTPLYVLNTKDYLNDSRDEGKSLALKKITDSNNPSKNDIYLGLMNESSNLGNITSNLTQADRNRLGNYNNAIDNNNLPTGTSLTKAETSPLLKIPILSSLFFRPINKLATLVGGQPLWADTTTAMTNDSNSSDAYLESFKKIFAFENNPYGSLMIGSDNLNVEQEWAIEAAKEDSTNGQGFLPIRECAQWSTTQPKTCLAWGTKTPASMVKEQQSNSLATRLVQYENAQTKGDVAQGNEPNVSELINMAPSAGGGGAPGSGLTNLNSLTQQDNALLRSNASINNLSDLYNGNLYGDSGNTGNSSDQSANYILNAILGLLSGVLNQSNTVSPSDADLINQNNSYLAENDLAGELPYLYFDQKPKGDQYLLYWLSPNADTCQAGNDWLSGSNVIKHAGDQLANWDSLLVATSTLAETTTYKIECNNSQGATSTSLSI